MSAINFSTQYRGIKGCQGNVLTGPTAATGYQIQYHAPLTADYTELPNGRIVYLDSLGWFTPICPVNEAQKFAMPLLLMEGGGKIPVVPQTFRYGQEAPYRTAIPQPQPNVTALPLCSGYEFLTTEYDDAADYTFNQVLTSIVDPAVNGGLDVGKVVPLDDDDQMCIGVVSRKPGMPRQYGDPATFSTSVPNPGVGVTGKNQPGLSFWGCPMPVGIAAN